MKILVGDKDEQCFCVCELDGVFVEDLKEVENFIKTYRKKNMELVEIVDKMSSKYKVKVEYFDHMSSNYFDIADMETEE